jgi:hypothetical protein
MNAAQQEAQNNLRDLMNKQQMFPPSPEELHEATTHVLHVMLGHKRRGIKPRDDQLSIDEVTA